MEKVQEQTAEVFENDIALYLKLFCEEQGIEDIGKESQSKWNAALMYIKRHVFNDSSVLKMSKPLEGYINNNYNSNSNYYKLNNSNCNAYDVDKVNDVCNIYIYMCYMYDKEISIMGFSKLTGISYETIEDWGRGDSRKLSTAGSVIRQKLTAEREESLIAKLINLKHPTAIAILLNKHFGYNLPGVREERQKIASRTPEEIAAGYGVAQVEEKKGLPDVPE